jgi:hypothetical protein
MSLLGMSLNRVRRLTAVARSGQPVHASSCRPREVTVELIQEEPATNAQRIAVFAYHREKLKASPGFRADLPYFGKAKEPPPANQMIGISPLQSGRAGFGEDGAESYLTSKDSKPPRPDGGRPAREDARWQKGSKKKAGQKSWAAGAIVSVKR